MWGAGARCYCKFECSNVTLNQTQSARFYVLREIDGITGLSRMLRCHEEDSDKSRPQRYMPAFYLTADVGSRSSPVSPSSGARK